MKPSSLSTIPAEVKSWLDSSLSSQGFSNYDDLTNQLNEKLSVHGFEISISRSALGRYGKGLKDRIADIKASAEAAKIMREAVNDDADTMSQANIALAQDALFKTLLALKNDDEEDNTVLLTKITRAIANISRASQKLKEWDKTIVSERVKAAAAKIDTIKVNTGLTQDTVDEIKAMILGIQQ